MLQNRTTTQNNVEPRNGGLPVKLKQNILLELCLMNKLYNLNTLVNTNEQDW